jgi:uncharacterized membrane protein
MLLLFIIITAEFWGRLAIYLIQLLKPKWFKKDFNVWSFKMKGGWMHKLFN